MIGFTASGSTRKQRKHIITYLIYCTDFTQNQLIHIIDNNARNPRPGYNNHRIERYIIIQNAEPKIKLFAERYIPKRRIRQQRKNKLKYLICYIVNTLDNIIHKKPRLTAPQVPHSHPRPRGAVHLIFNA